MTTVIITMAGFGRRFLDAGYTVPKYRIEAHGRSLFAWSMLSLRDFIDNGAHFIFVVRGADASSAFIRDEANALGIAKVDVVELDQPTDGQATTAMLAANAVADRTAPVVIYNIDTFVHPSALAASSVRGDGWIPCFNAAGDAWSFAAAEADGRVTVVREKVRISPHATVGLYHFGSFDLFADTYTTHYADPANIEKGERYVAPIYNTLIANGGRVFIHDVPVSDVIPLGVPNDVAAFTQRTPPEL